jgi:hypothetical protein
MGTSLEPTMCFLNVGREHHMVCRKLSGSDTTQV